MPQGAYRPQGRSDMDHREPTAPQGARNDDRARPEPPTAPPRATAPARAPRRRHGTLAALIAGTLVAALAPATAATAGTATPDAAPSASCTADGWAATATAIDPKDSHHAYVGNGYLGQRVPPNGMGYAAPGGTTGWPLKTPEYDGSFVSGLYAKGPANLQGRQAIAALPTWTTLDVTTGGPHPETFSSATAPGRISNYRQTLSLRCGFVRTSLTWTAADGRATDLVYDVLADRADAHTAAVRLRMTPHWSGRTTVTDTLDGRGARRMQPAGPAPGDRPAHPGTVSVGFRTDGTGTEGAVASTLRAGHGIPDARPEPPAKATGSAATTAEQLSAHQRLTFPVDRGRTYELTKYVGVDTALTSRGPRTAAETASRRAADAGWADLTARHRAAWQKLWRSDIEVTGQPELQSWIRSAQYGLLAATRDGSANSIGPTGLTSDNYAGEIFWDAETWMYPGLLATHPDSPRPAATRPAPATRTPAAPPRTSSPARAASCRSSPTA